MFTSLLLQVVTLSFLGLKCHAHSAAITICLKFIRKNNQNIFMPLLSAINLNQMKTNHSFPFISGRSNVISKKYQPFRFFSFIFYLCNFSDPFMSNYSVPFMCCSNFQSTAMFEGSECVQEEEEGGSTGSTVASSISACKKVKTGLVSYSLFSRPTTVNICLIRRTAHPCRFVYKNKERGAAGAQLTGLRWRPG